MYFIWHLNLPQSFRFCCQATLLKVHTQRIIIGFLSAAVNLNSLKIPCHFVCRSGWGLVPFQRARRGPSAFRSVRAPVISLFFFFHSKETGLSEKKKEKTSALQLFRGKNRVECLFLCIPQTYVTNWGWQHGPQYLNGSWCLYCDGYDLTWWAINMSDMTQMSSERIRQ